MAFGFCKSKPKHIRFIKDVYPPIYSIDAELISYNLSRLRLYAQTTSNKLPKIGKYLRHKARKDIDRKRFGHVKVTALIFADLVDSCHDRIRLFSKYMIDVLLDLNDLQIREIKSAIVMLFSRIIAHSHADVVPVELWPPFVMNFCAMTHCIPNNVGEVRGKKVEIICFGTESLDLESCLLMTYDGLSALRNIIKCVSLEQHGPTIFAAVLRAIKACMFDLNIDPDSPASLIEFEGPGDHDVQDILALACRVLTTAFTDTSSSSLSAMLRIVLNRFETSGWYGSCAVLGLIFSAIDATLSHIAVLDLVGFAKSLPPKNRMVAQSHAELLRLNDGDDAHDSANDSAGGTIELSAINLVTVDDRVPIIMILFKVLSALFVHKYCSLGPSIVEFLSSILSCIPPAEAKTDGDPYIDSLHESFVKLCGSLGVALSVSTQVSDALSYLISSLPHPSLIQTSGHNVTRYTVCLLGACQAVMDNLPVSLAFAPRPLTTSILHPLLKLLRTKLDSEISGKCICLLATLLDTTARHADFSRRFPNSMVPPKFHYVSSATVQDTHATYRNLSSMKTWTHNIRDTVALCVMMFDHDATFWVYLWRVIHAMLHELGNQEAVATLPMLMHLQSEVEDDKDSTLVDKHSILLLLLCYLHHISVDYVSGLVETNSRKRVHALSFLHVDLTNSILTWAEPSIISYDEGSYSETPEPLSTGHRKRNVSFAENDNVNATEFFEKPTGSLLEPDKVIDLLCNSPLRNEFPNLRMLLTKAPPRLQRQISTKSESGVDAPVYTRRHSGSLSAATVDANTLKKIFENVLDPGYVSIPPTSEDALIQATEDANKRLQLNDAIMSVPDVALLSIQVYGM